MEKLGIKTRDIKFKSIKNDAVVLVHNKVAREYAEWLERQDWVETYETNYPLDKERMATVNPVEIRQQYFEAEWATDFLIYCIDGSIAVREVTSMEQLQRHSHIVKLELSRHYWKMMGVTNRKLVLPHEGGAD